MGTLSMQHEYTLTKLEQKISATGGKMRYDSNRKAGLPNAKVSKRDPMDIEKIGVAGELAVAKYLNLYPDLSIFVRKSGADLLTHNNKKIDVKTTFYDRGKLIAFYKTDYGDVDTFVLVTAEHYPTVVIRGWAKREDLINNDKIGNLGYGKVFVMEQNELRDIDLLCFKLKSVNNDKKIPKRYPDNSKDDLSGYKV
tara:strand:+ start:134 stop:721 length:588 start_codon:yes stop_codon:yes gene_type:complete